MNALKLAQDKVARVRAAIADDNAVLQYVQDEIAKLERQIVELRQVHASKGLHEALIGAEAELSLAEEEALTQVNLNLAGEIMRRHAADPVANYLWVVEHIAKLRSSIRTGIDTPNNQQFSLHPLITQALALLPPIDDLNRPVYELGFYIAGQTDWPSRRKRILAEATA